MKKAYWYICLLCVTGSFACASGLILENQTHPTIRLRLRKAPFQKSIFTENYALAPWVSAESLYASSGVLIFYGVGVSQIARPVVVSLGDDLTTAYQAAKNAGFSFESVLFKNGDRVGPQSYFGFRRAFASHRTESFLSLGDIQDIDVLTRRVLELQDNVKDLTLLVRALSDQSTEMVVLLSEVKKANNEAIDKVYKDVQELMNTLNLTLTEIKNKSS
jgi:hypothetical protein